MSVREQNDRIAGGILQLLAHESERGEREREAPVENEIAATSWCHV